MKNIASQFIWSWKNFFFSFFRTSRFRTYDVMNYANTCTCELMSRFHINLYKTVQNHGFVGNVKQLHRCNSSWKEFNEVGNFSTFRTHARVNLDMTFHKIDLNPEATKISHENVWDAKKNFGVCKNRQFELTLFFR